jgi:hypothetical protein
MQHDGGHSSRFALRIDHPFYVSYAITKWNFVSKFYLKFRLHFLTYL